MHGLRRARGKQAVRKEMHITALQQQQQPLWLVSVWQQKWHSLHCQARPGRPCSLESSNNPKPSDSPPPWRPWPGDGPSQTCCPPCAACPAFDRKQGSNPQSVDMPVMYEQSSALADNSSPALRNCTALHTVQPHLEVAHILMAQKREHAPRPTCGEPSVVEGGVTDVGSGMAPAKAEGAQLHTHWHTLLCLLCALCLPARAVRPARCT